MSLSRQKECLGHHLNERKKASHNKISPNPKTSEQLSNKRILRQPEQTKTSALESRDRWFESPVATVAQSVEWPENGSIEEVAAILKWV